MNKRARHIMALVLIIVPFYMLAIVQKLLFSQNELFVDKFLSVYMILSIVGILAVLLTNKYLLKNSLTFFNHTKRRTIIDFALAFLLMAFFYFIQSIENFTYGRWFFADIDRSAVIELLDAIFSNVVSALIILCPFTWLNEIFAVLSLAFILNNLWALSPNRKWKFSSIFIAAILFAFLKVGSGIPAILSTFILISFANYVYLRYRSIFPLIISGILIQSIDLISFWVYY